MKRNSPHAIFVHCHCHLLQLAGVQAANHTEGIKHTYITLITLWKLFHYSPKRSEKLKEIQRVLNLPELKIVKPSDPCWLVHEKCVKGGGGGGGLDHFPLKFAFFFVPVITFFPFLLCK